MTFAFSSGFGSSGRPQWDLGKVSALQLPSWGAARGPGLFWGFLTFPLLPLSLQETDLLLDDSLCFLGITD